MCPSPCPCLSEAITEEAAVTKIEATAAKKAESSAKKKAKKLAGKNKLNQMQLKKKRPLIIKQLKK